MKSTFGSLIVLPLLAIVLIATWCRFRMLCVLVASVLGEIAGLYLYAAYNGWKVASVLSGLASGSVGYRGVEGPRSIVTGLLLFAALGTALGTCVLIGHRIYMHVKSG